MAESGEVLGYTQKRIGWHTLRHTFASMLFEKEVPIELIQVWMGHKDLNTTRRYIHFIAKYNPHIEKIYLTPSAEEAAMRLMAEKPQRGRT